MHLLGKSREISTEHSADSNFKNSEIFSKYDRARPPEEPFWATHHGQGRSNCPVVLDENRGFSGVLGETASVLGRAPGPGSGRRPITVPHRGVAPGDAADGLVESGDVDGLDQMLEEAGLAPAEDVSFHA